MLVCVSVQRPSICVFVKHSRSVQIIYVLLSPLQSNNPYHWPLCTATTRSNVSVKGTLATLVNSSVNQSA